MTTVSKCRKITVVRALGGVGDVLTAVPALRLLRTASPDSEIAYVGLPQVEPVVKRFKHLIDRFMAFPSFPGIVEAPFAPTLLDQFLITSRQTPADLAIQMHGSGSVSNVFVALLGARQTAGYYLTGLWCPDSATYAPYANDGTEAERWLRLIERLTGMTGSASLEFPITPEEKREAARLTGSAPYAVLHTGASDLRRQWSPEGFATVADTLTARGLRSVLTGTAAEAEIAHRVVRSTNAPLLDLVGLTSLGVAAAVVAGARLVVTNDTGTSHIAAAVGTPSVIVFLASDPARWAPLDRVRHRVVGNGIADTGFGSNGGIFQIMPPSVDTVLAAANDLLALAA